MWLLLTLRSTHKDLQTPPARSPTLKLQEKAFLGLSKTPEMCTGSSLRLRTDRQGSEIRVPVPNPPEDFYGGKITGTNDFAYFPGKSYGPRRPNKIEKMLSSRYLYEDLVSQPGGRAFTQTSNPGIPAKVDQLGQVGRHFAAFCLLGKAPLTNLDQVGPVLFPTIFRALLRNAKRLRPLNCK